MRILVVEDDNSLRSEITVFLENFLGHNVTQCSDGLKALELFKNNPFPMVLTDVCMPGVDGIELLKKIKKLPDGKNTDVVLITGHGDINMAIQALRAGACDFFPKPVQVNELVAIISKIEEHQSLLEENSELTNRFEENLAEATKETEVKYNKLQRAYADAVGLGDIVADSDAMKAVVILAGKFHEDRSVPVLIEGETGTGKELIARLIHYGKEGVSNPYVSLNCSAIAPNLFESELFGYEAGAYTGAGKRGSRGKLDLAQGGTLLLDEIGDLPQGQQPKLLRVLYEREFYRVGGIKKIKLDARIICATNRNLEQEVEKGAFRRDLFYRLNLGRIYLTPLRERRDDILPLALKVLEICAEQKKRRTRFIHPEALKILQQHSWPGNVRELQNVIERVVLFSDDIEMKPEHLKFLLTGNNESPVTEGSTLEPGTIVLPQDRLDFPALGREIIRKALEKFDGNQSRSAEYLNITRSVLRSWLKKIN